MSHASEQTEDADPHPGPLPRKGEAGDRLSLVGIDKHFGDIHVLDHISFDVAPGEFLTLLGPSGCGKTTLLRVIAGLELPDAGTITLGSLRLDELPAQKRPVNTVFQNYGLFPHLSVFDNVAFGLRARRFADAIVREKVTPALALLQIEPLTKRYPHQLSGGQKQRVALARALVNEPSVLLLDEPMSALDAKLRAEVRLELRRLQRRLGRTFILVTHDQDEAMTVSDRVIVMSNGRIEQAGTPAEVYERPRNRFVAEFLGAANLISAKREGEIFRTPLGNLRAREIPAWHEGLLAIRPERIHLITSAAMENTVQGRVKEVVYRGAYQELLVEPGPLRIHAPTTQTLRPGDVVTLELPREHLGALLE